MSDIIDFLEKMGQNAQLRHASHNDLGLALADSSLDPQAQAAILAEDQPRIEALLNVRVNCCYYLADDGQDDEFDFEKCA